MTPTSYYLNYLYDGSTPYPAPSNATIQANLASMKPNAVVAETQLGTPLANFLIKWFGPPTAQNYKVLGWRVKPGTVYPVQAKSSG